NSGTFRLTNASLNIGNSGLFGNTLQLAANQHIDVPNSSVSIDPGALLVLSAPTSILSGGALTNNGTISGTGQITNNLANSSTGIVRTSNGDWLRFAGAVNTNDGQILLINGGETDFSGALVNDSSGVIAGRGVISALGGLLNNGQMQLSGGFADV